MFCTRELFSDHILACTTCSVPQSYVAVVDSYVICYGRNCRIGCGARMASEKCRRCQLLRLFGVGASSAKYEYEALVG